ncbi:MAG: hypothetical protein ABSE17_04440 [Candidatus Levyibacteriota bacterium]
MPPEEERFEEDDSSVVELETHPRRALQKKRHHITVGGIVRSALLATTLLGGGAYVAPQVINWGQSIINPDYSDINSNHGNYNLAAPSGRIQETPNPSEKAMTTTPGEIPHLIPITFSQLLASPGGYDSNIGLDAFPDGDPIASDPEASIDPVAVISGYLVSKEKQPDGSYLFGVELPNLDGSVFNGSVSSTTPVCEETSAKRAFDVSHNSKEDVIGGAIVWLKFFPGEKSDFYPLFTPVTYGDDAFTHLSGDKAEGVGPDVFYADTKLGDPVRALLNLGGANFNSTNWQQSLKTYVNNGHAKDIADAEAQMQTILNQNTNSLNNLKSDNGKSISLKNQLQEKRYIFTPNMVAFLPTTP